MDHRVSRHSPAHLGWRAWFYGLIPLTVAILLRGVMEPILEDKSPFSLFLLAVMIGAVLGGGRVGVAATVIGTVVGVLFISESPGLHHFASAGRIAQLLLFVSAALGATVLAKAMRDSRSRIQAFATEQGRLAEELGRANRIKDDFLATVSHELRTPLNAILGWSELLTQGVVNEGDVPRALAAIHRNAKIQVQLIDDLLDLARIEAGKLRLAPRAIDPEEPIAAAVETVQPAARAKNVAVWIEGRSSSIVWADANRIQQVVWNLLSNAVRFTRRNGRVTVVVEERGKDVVIRVHDTGPGIPEDLLGRVFDRFTQDDASSTRKTGGLGLGLAIVREVVELHGGSVTARNDPAGGAIFEVALPKIGKATDAIGADSSAAARREPRALLGKRVVVVDDEPDARELMRSVLMAAGAEVQTAKSVAEALELLRRGVPHAILTDIAMPMRDGFDLLGAVRSSPSEEWRSIPIGAVSAYATERDRSRALAAGFAYHLAKPVSPADLALAVEHLIAKRSDTL